MADLNLRRLVLKTLRAAESDLTQISLRLGSDPDPAAQEVLRFVREARDAAALGRAKAQRVGWPHASGLGRRRR